MATKPAQGAVAKQVSAVIHGQGFGDLDSKLPRSQGFVTTLHQGSHGNYKITRYDFAKLVRVSAVWTMFVRGTVFNLDKAIHITIFSYAVVFLLAWSSLAYLGDPEEFEMKSLPVIMEISYDLQRFCPFVFGLFTSIMLSRWWSLRTEAVGAVGDHCINVSGILVSVAARVLYSDEDWRIFREMHIKVVKYGIASLSCIVMESRTATGAGAEDKAHGLGKLVELNVLTQHEMDILETSVCHASCLWCWIQAMSVEALEMMQVPPPNINMLYQEVRNAMQGIHNVQKYLKTQLPFPYVHMITLLVNVNSLVIAIVAGVQCAIGQVKGQTSVVIVNAVKVFMLPVLSHGLLQICVFLSDPFGDDIIDFPIRSYQHDVSQACQDHLTTRALYEQRWREGVAPQPNSIFIRQLPPRRIPTDPEKDGQAMGTVMGAGMVQALTSLDERLGLLAQSTSSLTASVGALQEGLSQSNASVAASTGALQSQVKELALLFPSVASPFMGRAPGALPSNARQNNQSPLSCCAVQPGLKEGVMTQGPLIQQQGLS